MFKRGSSKEQPAKEANRTSSLDPTIYPEWWPEDAVPKTSTQGSAFTLSRVHPTQTVNTEGEYIKTTRSDSFLQSSPPGKTRFRKNENVPSQDQPMHQDRSISPAAAQTQPNAPFPYPPPHPAGGYYVSYVPPGYPQPPPSGTQYPPYYPPPQYPFYTPFFPH